MPQNLTFYFSMAELGLMVFRTIEQVLLLKNFIWKNSQKDQNNQIQNGVLKVQENKVERFFYSEISYWLQLQLFIKYIGADPWNKNMAPVFGT